MIYFICNNYFTADAVQNNNQITEQLWESTRIPNSNQTLNELFRKLNNPRNIPGMFALESEILQTGDEESNGSLNESDTPKLSQDSSENKNENDEVGETQLMTLCSGTIETQHPAIYPENVSHIEYCVKGIISFHIFRSADGAEY